MKTFAKFLQEFQEKDSTDDTKKPKPDVPGQQSLYPSGTVGVPKIGTTPEVSDKSKGEPNLNLSYIQDPKLREAIEALLQLPHTSSEPGWRSGDRPTDIGELRMPPPRSSN